MTWSVRWGSGQRVVGDEERWCRQWMSIDRWRTTVDRRASNRWKIVEMRSRPSPIYDDVHVGISVTRASAALDVGAHQRFSPSLTVPVFSLSLSLSLSLQLSSNAAEDAIKLVPPGGARQRQRLDANAELPTPPYRGLETARGMRPTSYGSILQWRSTVGLVSVCLSVVVV